VWGTRAGVRRDRLDGVRPVFQTRFAARFPGGPTGSTPRCGTGPWYVWPIGCVKGMVMSAHYDSNPQELLRAAVRNRKKVQSQGSPSHAGPSGGFPSGIMAIADRGPWQTNLKDSICRDCHLAYRFLSWIAAHEPHAAGCIGDIPLAAPRIWGPCFLSGWSVAAIRVLPS